MTPKEKAEELVDKFHIEVLDRDGTSAMNEDYQNDIWSYWKEVKQEIENL